MERNDGRFALLLGQVKRTNRVAVEIARDIRQQQRHLLEGNRQLQEGQKEANRLLGEILKRLPPGSIGK